VYGETGIVQGIRSQFTAIRTWSLFDLLFSCHHHDPTPDICSLSHKEGVKAKEIGQSTGSA